MLKTHAEGKQSKQNKKQKKDDERKNIAIIDQ